MEMDKTEASFIQLDERKHFLELEEVRACWDALGHLEDQTHELQLNVSSAPNHIYLTVIKACPFSRGFILGWVTHRAYVDRKA